MFWSVKHVRQKYIEVNVSANSGIPQQATSVEAKNGQYLPGPANILYVDTGLFENVSSSIF
jgi:hypothetical protein